MRALLMMGSVAVVSIGAGGAQCAVGGNTCPSRALWEPAGTVSKVCSADMHVDVHEF